MSPDEHELLADLTRVCEHASLFVLEFTAGELSVEAEEACAFRLVDVAEELLRHARHRKFAAGCKLEAANASPVSWRWCSRRQGVGAPSWVS